MRHLGWFGALALLLAACAAGTGTPAVQQITLETSAAPVVLHPTTQPSPTPRASTTPAPSVAPSSRPSPNGTTVGKNPAGIAFDNAGNAWIANFGSDSVSEVDSNGQVIASYGVGHEPERLVVAPDGVVWVSDYGSNAVTEIANGVVLRQISVGQQPEGIAADTFQHIWVANAGSGTVTKLSSSGDVLGTYQVGGDANSHPTDLVTDGSGIVWVVCRNGGLFGLDQTGLETAGNQLDNRSPRSITRDASGNFWITFNAPDDAKLAELDPHGQTRAIVSALLVAPSIVGPGGVDSNGDYWCANTPYTAASDGSYAQSATDAATVSDLSPQGRVLGSYAAGGDAFAAAVDAKGVVWVLNYAAGTVTRVAPGP